MNESNTAAAPDLGGYLDNVAAAHGPAGGTAVRPAGGEWWEAANLTADGHRPDRVDAAIEAAVDQAGPPPPLVQPDPADWITDQARADLEYAQQAGTRDGTADRIAGRPQDCFAQADGAGVYGRAYNRAYRGGGC